MRSFHPLELRLQTKRRSDTCEICSDESQAGSPWSLLLRPGRVGWSYLCSWITLSHAYEKIAVIVFAFAQRIFVFDKYMCFSWLQSR